MVSYKNPALREEPLGEKPVIVLPGQAESLIEQLEREGRLVSREIDRGKAENFYNEEAEALAEILDEPEPYGLSSYGMEEEGGADLEEV